MSIESGAVILVDSSGNEIAVQGGVATPANQRGYHALGSDGTNSRFLLVDASGRPIITGAETPGTAPTAKPLLVAGNDGTNVRTFKTTTAGALLSALTDGTDTVGISTVGSDKALKVDVIQSVAGGGGGTVAQGTGAAANAPWSVRVSDGTSYINPATDRATAAAPFSVRLSDGTSFYNAPAAGQLPSALVSGRLDANIGAWLGSTAPTVGQKAMASSLPVVISSDQTAIPISGSITATNPSVGTTGAGAPTSATQIGGSDGTTLRNIHVDSTGAVRLQSGGTPGSSAPNRATMIGGSDGSNLRTVHVDSNGAIRLQSGGTAGSTAPNRTTLVGGSDGTNLRSFRTDTAGNILSKLTDGTDTVGISTVGAAKALKVDVVQSVGGSGGDGAIVDGVSSAIKATVLDYTNSNPLAVRLTDVNGDYVAAGAGTQYTEDAASAADPSGSQLMARRRDTLATETSADGDVTALNATAKGELYVKHSDAVAAQIITPAALAAGLSPATVFPAGFLRTTDEPRQLFYDPYEGSSLDTTNWNSAVSSGGGVAAAVASGNLTLGTGTTASGYSYLQSTNSFRLTIPGWLGISHALRIESGTVTANTYRFWGEGTVPTTPTAAAPVTNGVGFEVRTDGKMYAVVYSNGTRTAVQDLSSATGNAKQPTDGNFHRYIVMVRTDRMYWYIDTLDTPVATASFVSPQVQTLPILYLAVANTSAPSSSGVITAAGIAVWDSAKNNTAISDPTYPWRRARVTSAGELTVVGGDTTASKGLGTPTDYVEVDTTGKAVCAIQVTGTWEDGTNGLSFTASIDGSNYFALPATRLNENTTSSLTPYTSQSNAIQTNTNGYWIAPCSGFSKVRVTAVVMGIITPGTANVTLRASTQPVDFAAHNEFMSFAATARDAWPTAASDGGRSTLLSDRWGRLLTSHVDPTLTFSKSFNATTAQTGAAVWTPSSSLKGVAITSVVIGSYGTTAGRFILWFGATADTTYTAGTDQLVLAASFAPSASSKPGLVFTPAHPIYGPANQVLRVTTDAALSVDVAVHGYEWKPS